MKYNTKSLTFFLIAALWLASCAKDQNQSSTKLSPEAFNNQIVQLQFTLYNNLTQFMEAVRIYNVKAIQIQYNKLSKTCKNSMASIDTLPQTGIFRGYWQAANKLFSFYSKTILQEYGNIVDLLLQPTDSITEAQINHIDSVSRNMMTLELKLRNDFNIAQDSFAQINHLELQTLPADSI